MIGRTVSHYRILSQLGAGGMGVVYEAEDIRLDRKVALKFLAPELTRDREARHRFVNEAKAASSLEHPAICTVHEIDQTDDGHTFMVMPRYEGQTLQERLGQEQLPVDEAVDIALQLACGMAKAHGRGIVHRDLKPGNVFLTSDGHVVILDFGLAKLSGATKVTRDGTTLGTPAYLSPEQARGQEADTRSDVWELGVVLYEMLAGRPPFTGEHPQALIYAIQNEKPPPMADVPEAIAEIVARCLKKDPADRYTNADELREDLERASRGEGLRPRWRWRWTQLLAPIILVVTIVGVKLLQDGEQAPEQIPEHRKSIAVMPFLNLTGDESYDVWILGLPELMNLDLSNSAELYVLDHQTLQVILGDVELVQAATISFAQMHDIAERVYVETLIQGSILKAGPNLRIQLKLLDAGTGASLATMRVDGRSEDDFFAMADSLTSQVRDLLEIDALKQWNPEFEDAAVGTRSAEAFRLYLEGAKAKRKGEFDVGAEKLTRAVEIDSTFYIAWLELAGNYANLGDLDTYFDLIAMVEGHESQLPLQLRLRMELFLTPENSGCDREDLLSQIRTCRRLLEMNPQGRDEYANLSHRHLLDEDFEAAAENYAKWEEISSRWGNYDAAQPGLLHYGLGEGFYRAGRIEEAIAIFTRGRDITPMADFFEWWLTLAHLSRGDTVQAALHRQALKAGFDEGSGEDERRELWFDALLHTDLDNVDRAVSLWRTIFEKYPDDIRAANSLAYLLINHEIDVEEGVAIVENILDRHPDLRSPDRRVHWPWYCWGYFDWAEPDYLGTLGWGYFKQGKYKQAVDALEIACEQWLLYYKPLDRHLDLAQADLTQEQHR